MMKLWVDNVRDVPQGHWLQARSVNEAKDFILMSEASMSGFASIDYIDIHEEMLPELQQWLKDNTDKHYTCRTHK